MTSAGGRITLLILCYYSATKQMGETSSQDQREHPAQRGVRVPQDGRDVPQERLGPGSGGKGEG